MRRLFPVILLFTFGSFDTSLAGDEPRAGAQSISDLIKQLGDKNSESVCAAAKTLGQGKSAKDAVPALKELLKSRNSRVKWTAAEALWRLEHKAAELLPVYAELLTASDPDLRAASAWRLGRLGSDARPVVPLLAAALRDENFEVRVQVGQALANLGPWAEPALPALVRALGDKQLDEPGDAKEDAKSVRSSPALPALLELADEAIPLLIDTFRQSAIKHREDHSAEVRAWQVAGRVAQAFPAFRGKALAPLMQSLESKDAENRYFAALALRETAELNGLPQTAIEKLEPCLDDPDKMVRMIASRTLAGVRPSNAKIVTVLVKSSEDGGINNKELLVDLARMSPHNEAARKLLFGKLDDNEAETAYEAHRLLSELELPTDQVLGVWIKALAHADRNVRSVAVNALRRLGAGAKPAKAALHERFKKENGKDSSIKSDILDALTAIDPDDPALIPFLIESLEDRDWRIRRDAIRCLATLGPKANDAIPRIEACLSNAGEKAKEDGRNWKDDDFVSDLLSATVRIAPGSTKSAATLLKALRHRDIRSLHVMKNEWYMRDVLEDHLQATLPAAAPLLREALKDQDAEVRQSAALVLLRAGLEVETALPVLMEKLWIKKDVSHEQWRFQIRALELMSRRQSSVSPAVAAAWCKAWQSADPKDRKILERWLLVLQPECLPHLLDQLRDAKTTQERRNLAHLLAKFEGQSQQIVPILREELREEKAAAQYAAMQALSDLGPDAAEAVPDLVKLLSHANPGMRAVAATALASIGRAARPAVPALKAMLKDDKPALRLVAADALSQIDPDASEALAVLRDVLVREKTERFRFSIGIELPPGLPDSHFYPGRGVESILRFGERGAPILAEALDNIDLDEWSAENVSTQCGSEARIWAALLLARLGSEAKSAVPALVRALKDKDPFLREAAASALGRIGSEAKQAAPDMIGLLEQQNRLASAGGSWSSSPRTGGRSGADNSDYRGPFNFRSAGRGRLLDERYGFGYGYGTFDPYKSIRPDYPYDPVSVLSRIDSEARSAQPILKEIARDASHPGRLSAALALWRSGCESPDLIPAFTAALEAHAQLAKQDRVALSRELTECLSELDLQLKPAVRVMIEWLKQSQFSRDEDEVAVVEALGRLGSEARAAADVIRPMLAADRWNAKRRVAAALALFRTGEDKDRAFSVLREVSMGLEEHSWVYYSVDLSSTARVSAMRALGVLAEKGDERAKTTISEMAKGDENPYVRQAAREALTRLKR